MLPAQATNYKLFPFCLWGFIAYLGVFWLKFHQINHYNHFLLFSIYMLICNTLFIWLYQDVWRHFKLVLDKKRVIILGLFYLMVAAMYYFYKPNRLALAEYPNVHFAYFSHSYILSKSLDILFQQILVTGFVYILWQKGLGFKAIKLIFLGVVLLLHVTAFLTMPFYVALTFLTLSGVASVIWVTLLEKSQYGLIYNYLIHWGFYVVYGLWFNLYIIA